MKWKSVFIHLQTSIAMLLNFGNGQVISSHIHQCLDLSLSMLINKPFKSYCSKNVIAINHKKQSKAKTEYFTEIFDKNASHYIPSVPAIDQLYYVSSYLLGLSHTGWRLVPCCNCHKVGLFPHNPCCRIIDSKEWLASLLKYSATSLGVWYFLGI